MVKPKAVKLSSEQMRVYNLMRQGYEARVYTDDPRSILKRENYGTYPSNYERVRTSTVKALARKRLVTEASVAGVVTVYRVTN